MKLAAPVNDLQSRSTGRLPAMNLVDAALAHTPALAEGGLGL